MLFNSLEFLWFFPVAVFIYYAAGQKLRIPALLTAGIWFYAAWKPIFLIVLFACIISAYAGGLLITKSVRPRRSMWLAVSIIIPLGMLLVFKYYGFFIETIFKIAGSSGTAINPPLLKLALPIGISFFTFKTLSYLFDVHKGRIPVEKSFLKVAAYISFFPQILAGPIDRPGNFFPQLDKKCTPDANRIADGLALILWGLFKKVVVADNLATVANWVYFAPQNYSGLPLIVATYAYAIQIYCDFSGYSDMAIGTARILGFSSMKNFDRPYVSQSISEFWRRWHISLSTWFRDYVYIPLGGSRVSTFRWIINVLIVFLVSGLWHGAYWTFIIWGGIHGLFLVGERFISPLLIKTPGFKHINSFPVIAKSLRIGLTFNLVAFSWIFFRAKTVSDALYVATNMFNGLNRGINESLAVFKSEDLITGAILTAVLLIAPMVSRGMSGLVWLRKRPVWVRWIAYAVLVLAIINLRPEYNSGFIYLQF